MSGCSTCMPGRGCRDFSSRAEQLPSLAAIDVVERLLLQALKNTAGRAQRTACGDMTPEALDEANETLVDWLAATFSGRNPHFQSVEDWNPRGLAQYMREMMPESLQTAAPEKGARLDDDEEVIHLAAGIFLSDVYATLHALASRGCPFDGIENADPCVRLVGFWSQLLVGAPIFDSARD